MKGLSMKRLTTLVATVSLVFSGYWFVGANTLDRALEGALIDLETVSYTHLTLPTIYSV